MRGSASMRRLARRMLEEQAKLWRPLVAQMRSPPSEGWIRAIRDGLGMSQRDLARRMGIAHTSVSKMELRERDGTIQLDTLSKAADALGCDLVYALVPRTALQAMVDDRRLAIFEEIVARTKHTMRLEGEDVHDLADAEWRAHFLRQAEDLIPDAQLWRDPKAEG